jgi:hypothetical protein
VPSSPPAARVRAGTKKGTPQEPDLADLAELAAFGE